MKLKNYDDKEVRITLKNGEVFEGACQWNDAEYNEYLVGHAEQGLAISGWLFYKSDIKKVEEITPKNPYNAPFGTIETEAVKDGYDTVEDALFSDEPRNVYRLLSYLARFDDPALLFSPAEAADAPDMLGRLARYFDDDERVQTAALRLREKWRGKN